MVTQLPRALDTPGLLLACHLPQSGQCAFPGSRQRPGIITTHAEEAATLLPRDQREPGADSAVPGAGSSGREPEATQASLAPEPAPSQESRHRRGGRYSGAVLVTGSSAVRPEPAASTASYRRRTSSRSAASGTERSLARWIMAA